MIDNAPSIHAVLFDLDGTLLDTAPDLVNALNLLLQNYNKPLTSLEKARNIVSQGGVAITRHGFPEVTDENEFEQLRQEFLSLYANNVCNETTLFDGMSELLSTIESQNIPWGIVTNKPGWLTDPLLSQLHITKRATCVISGDTLSVRKPHPDPLLLASKKINLPTQNTIYIGDDPRDIYAGNAAGMYTCVAEYGYIEADIDTAQWGADFTINHPLELLNYIQLSSPIYEMGT